MPVWVVPLLVFTLLVVAGEVGVSIAADGSVHQTRQVQVCSASAVRQAPMLHHVRCCHQVVQSVATTTAQQVFVQLQNVVAPSAAVR